MIDRLDLKRDGRRLLTYGTRARTPISCCAPSAPTAARSLIDADLGARVKGGARSIRGWQVPIPGHHNALNALAAIAVAAEAGTRGRRDPFRARGLLGRQAALPAYRHVERHSDLRRLRPLTRPRSRPCRRRRAPARGAASSPSSSRIAIRACATCSVISPPASRRPIMSSSRRMYTAGESPIDGIDQQDAGRGHPRRRSSGGGPDRRSARSRGAHPPP